MGVNSIDLINNTFLNNTDEVNDSKNDNKDISFGDYLKDALDKVNDLQVQSEEYKKLSATGELDNLHDVSIAAEKAGTALDLLLSVRNKVVEAYKEIMRIQI
ncbi:flagellar hook-basal body complex protein FliE [Acidilutibacter cellobiosedens]|jgi:flagellar hook-basal body complex protein FliE|uniref:Flagellar hook-basal body complex protein FliE n=1 Tax=Acidilutibacter cellobiosedens TaxID=2507161 RepID=A0A410QC15_9FIRM|nr:flagellar hook-basal body complex protein FliE [Acidilutibacter cellobiosedens]MBE6081764.1 flagellar hook-basal body complex protein FliE [Tissierellaceae bacterium]QAT61602.1 flagellar hook-basal body complex protein FliE [Acidilutibacter cellobiosedens]